MWKPIVLLLAIGMCVGVLWARAQTGVEGRRAADDLMTQGVSQFQQGQYDVAFQSWQRALELYQALGDRQRQAWVLENLGTAALELKQAERARDYFVQGLGVARALPDPALEGKLLGKLGRVYRALSDTQGAIDTYQQLLQDARATANREGEEIALGSLGIVYKTVKEYGKAIEYLRQALAIARQLHDRDGEKVVLGNLGEVYLDREQYVNAVEAFWQALTLARQVGDGRGQVTALWQLGNSHYYLGEYSKALSYLEESLRLAQAQGNKEGQMSALRGLGNTAYALRQLDRAVAYYQQNLALARVLHNRRSEGLALGNLALVYSDLGQYGIALDYYKQDLTIAREFEDRLAEGQALANLGIVFLYQKDYTTAIEHFRQSLTIVQALGYRRGEGIALTNMGLALFKAGNLPQAEAALRDAIKVLDSVREKAGSLDAYNISLFETHLRTYRYLQTTLIAQGRTADALHVAEQGRARALLELLSRRQSPLEDSMPRLATPVPHEIQQMAQAHKITLVEYAIIPDEAALYIWVVQPTGQIVFRQVSLPPATGASGTVLDDLVRQARQSLGVGGRGLLATKGPDPQPDETLHALFRLLVQPVAEYFPTDPEALLVFIPQGPLFLVPFHALRDDAGRFLLERHTVLTAPSIQTLQLAHANATSHTRGGPSELVVGNPVMPSLRLGPDTAAEPLPSLPGAEREARAIAALLGQEALTGAQATKHTVLERMRAARLVHLATHGLLDDFKGLGVPGAIALAPAGGDDGLLTAAEIMDLRLQADLVVLSACDTAQGHITGDGVIGLSRSFIAAGVPSVVVSLWSVPDAPTAELMMAFYKYLGQDRNKARALRHAMLDTHQHYAAPRDWAAFILVGNAE